MNLLAAKYLDLWFLQLTSNDWQTSYLPKKIELRRKSIILFRIVVKSKNA